MANLRKSRFLVQVAGAALAMFLVSGCQLTGSKNSSGTDSTNSVATADVNAKGHFTACPKQRPEICTRQYDPVCAMVDTGVRCATTPCPSIEYKTKSNACTACADPNVISYKAGKCI